jgi:hypothetical protein
LGGTRARYQSIIKGLSHANLHVVHNGLRRSIATLPAEARKVELLLPIGGHSEHFKTNNGPRVTAPVPTAKGLWI